jgi:hypothetical protein
MKNPAQSNRNSDRSMGWLTWGGALLCLLLAGRLTVNSQSRDIFKRATDPLSLNRSPYGMLLSSLLQQPVNTEWHKGIETHDASHDGEHDHEEGHEEGHDHKDAVEKQEHHHAEGEHCEACDIAAGRFRSRAPTVPLLDILSEGLDKLTTICAARTNPLGISPAHKLYIARNIEKKLLVSYNLDPTSYAAYDAYFLFLTENLVDGLGSPEKIAHARLITNKTLALSSREEINPLPSLTAALATYNLFMLQIAEGKSKDKNFNQELYASVIQQLAKYQRLKIAADKEGIWEQVPEAWRIQADDRATFLLKVAKGLAEKSAVTETK